MAVKKKVIPSIESFIDKGAEVKANEKKPRFTNVLVRIPMSILNRVDKSLERKPWMSRTQWIVEAIDEKLETWDER